MSKDTQNHDPHRLKPAKWVFAGLIAVLAVFGGGGAWSVLTEISGAVIAPGTVSVENGIKTLQHPYGGVVKAIYVRDGAKVRAGDILLILEDETLKANLAITEARLDASLAELARLEAERDGASGIAFDKYLLDRSDVASANRAMKTQRLVFEARHKMLDGQKDILEQKMTALESRLRGLRAELKSKKEQNRLINEEVATVEQLLEKGQARKPRLLLLQRQAAALQGERGRLLGQIAQTEKNISEISMQILQLEKDYLARVLGRLAEVQTEADSLREKLTELHEKLARIEIRAPVNGRVLDLSIHTVGGVIAAGKPVMRIVPDDAPLVVEAQVSTSDIDQVSPDQDVRIVFSAFNSRTTPTLHGKIRMISPAPLLDPVIKRPFYKVEIVVPPKQIARLGGDLHLVPGMPVESFIDTTKRSPMNLLLSPFHDVARHALRQGY